MINKVDRLVLEVGASPGEAYERMRGIVAHVNMILSAFRSEQLISDADALLATEDARAAQPRCERVLEYKNGHTSHYLVVHGLRGCARVLCNALNMEWPDGGTRGCDLRGLTEPNVTAF